MYDKLLTAIRLEIVNVSGSEKAQPAISLFYKKKKETRTSRNVPNCCPTPVPVNNPIETDPMKGFSIVPHYKLYIIAVEAAIFFILIRAVES